MPSTRSTSESTGWLEFTASAGQSLESTIAGDSLSLYGYIGYDAADARTAFTIDFASGTSKSNFSYAPLRPVPVVYLASGTMFPDALTGSAWAAAAGAPLYLVQPNCVPQAVLADIAAFHAERIVVLGGPNTLGQGVSDLVPCG